MRRASPTDVPLQVSGGIRSIDAARAALDAGAVEGHRRHRGVGGRDALELFAQRLSASNCSWPWTCATVGSPFAAGPSRAASIVDDALARCRDAGVVRLHVTAIDRDGTMRGPDLDLYRQVCASGIPVVAAGGIRDDHDVARVGRRRMRGGGDGPRLSHSPRPDARLVMLVR